MPQKRTLDDAWAGATSIGPPTPSTGPLPLPAADEFLRRAPDFPSFLDLLSLVPGLDTLDSGPATIPAEAIGKLIGRAGRTPGWLKNTRIAKGGQNSLPTELKIPRFRSPAGDFVKYQGQWWRLKPFAADSPSLTLELLEPGPQTVDSKVLESVTVPMKDFYASVLEAKRTVPKSPSKRK